MQDNPQALIPAPAGPPPDWESKPGLVMAIAILTLISGAVNIFWAFNLTAGAALSIIGLVCVPITILPGILGIFEIIYAVRLLANPPRPQRPSQTLAVLEICSVVYLNFVAVIIGILVLVFYNDPAAQAYFARVNSPAPAASSGTTG